MTRHLRWLIPLAATVVTLIGLLWFAGWLGRPHDPRWTLLLVLAGTGTGLLALAVLVAGPIVTIRGAHRVFRAWRRSTGHPNRAEWSAQLAAEQRSTAWQAAVRLRATLIRREVPETIEQWMVVPRQGEMFFLDIPAVYARYYGTDVTYNQTSSFLFGSPTFVAAGLALTAIGNASARSGANAIARAQWREQQLVRTLVSNQRILCQVGGSWLSFDFGAVRAIYPDVESWALVLDFENSQPLLLQGDGVPAASVIAVMMTHGWDAVARHPGLARLGEVENSIRSQH